MTGDTTLLLRESKYAPILLVAGPNGETVGIGALPYLLYHGEEAKEHLSGKTP
jgi:hypothetical protein